MPGELGIDNPEPGVLRLSIKNPGKRNALDLELLDAIAKAVGFAETDPAIRCVILTGSDGMFSSGYDIADVDDETFFEDAERLIAHPYASAVEVLDRTNIPTIAALTGHTIGGGLELSLACDLRLARDGIKLGMPPAKLGLVYSHTGLKRFLRLIGEGRTRELFLLGRYIDAPTACSWGLINGVCEDEEALVAESLVWAAELAANAPLSVAGNKEVLRTLLRADHDMPPEEEARLIALRQQCFESHDLREGIAAFAEKRPARWRGE